MLKLLSLFSGIGAFEKALSNIGEPFEVVRYCEIDKYASKAYSLIHNLDENMNLGDITQVDTYDLPDDIDIVTYGFPCQDISNAGKQKGFTDDNGELTRSGLFFEALRIIEDTQPYFAICENVKALTSKKFKTEFKIVLDSLNAAGYKNYWAVLNAKDYGIPQNRERVFVISIRDDIDHGYTFPEKYELKLRLKDMLEVNVDEKYYLSNEQIKILEKKSTNNSLLLDKSMIGFEGKPREYNEVAPTITAREYKEPRLINETVLNEVIRVGNCNPSGKGQNGAVIDADGVARTVTVEKGEGQKVLIKQVAQIYPNSGNPQAGRIYDAEGISPAMDTCSGGNRMPKIVEPKKLFNIYPKNGQAGNVYDANSCEPCIPGFGGGGGGKELKVLEDLRIRKLTPKECFRLMGFDDCDIDVLIENGISNTQLYKMAGNSIVVDVLEEIFVELLNQYEEVFPYVG